MKKNLICFLSTIAITFISCEKNSEYKEIEKNEETISVTCEFDANSETKTTLGENNTPLWSNGDEIWISDGGSKTKKVVLGETSNADDIAGTITNDGKSFTFKIESSFGTDIFAVYPYDRAKSANKTSNQIIFNLPQTQDGSFSSANICVSRSLLNEDKITLNFKNSTAIVYVKQGSSGSDYTMFMSNSDKVINGDCTVGFEDNGTINTFSCSGGTKFVEGPMDVNGAYLAVAPTESSNWKLRVKQASELKVAEKNINNKSVNINSKISITAPTNYSIPGYFTIDAKGTQVEFSKGNLQAVLNNEKTAATEWRFASNQWETIGQDNFKSVIDLFGWSSDGVGATSGWKQWGINKSEATNDYKGGFCDWGSNDQLKTNLGSGWFTLSKSQWDYLIDSRTDAATHYGPATVNNIHGVVIIPDGISSPKFKNYGTKYNTWSANVFTREEWLSLEILGYVFLPVEGIRTGGKVESNDAVYIWTSSCSSDFGASHLFGTYAQFQTYAGSYHRIKGLSVRLVKVKPTN